MYDEKKFSKFLREVEDFFIEKRGTPFILSSEDVHLILFWFNKGYSLKIIKKGIGDVFEKLKEKNSERKVNSIKFCAQRIEELQKEEQKRISRSWHFESKKIEITPVLDKNIELIKTFFEKKDEYQRQKNNFIKKIEELKKIDDLDKIEDGLKKIEEKIIEIFYKKIEKEEKEKIKKEAEKNLPEEIRNLPSIVKNSLIKMILFEKIKKEKEIPNLTLLL